MCGFCGCWNPVEFEFLPRGTLESMASAIQHRGPDGEGFWRDSDLGVALAHRRLAIQDLSSHGAQPMASSTGRYVIAFNGEIYNFKKLRSELVSCGVEFGGHSDTEVMLAAFERWGVAPSLDRFSGMFAFALLDRFEKKLILARDRMGEKPLYYGWQRGTLLFGSELTPLTHHPDWKGEINRDALPLLLRHNLIPAPHSIYVGIQKLLPASMVSFDLDSLETGFMPEPERYWRLETQFTESPGFTLESASDRLESLLTEVVGEQMVSDVPLGAFLSGGIDSSTVVALMQKQASRPVRTFSIGFHEEGFNEAEHAAAVANHLGTEHTEMYVTPQNALDVIPKLSSIYDEPFADSSQIPTYLVSQMTKKHVTVALSGDGGDELFCGYSRYPSTVRAWQGRGRPKARAKALLSQLPSALTSPLISMIAPSQRGRSLTALRRRLADEKGTAQAGSLSEFYRQRISYWQRPGDALIMNGDPAYTLTDALPQGVSDDPLKALMWRDLNWYLPDDILTKVDRAAMACSLETRIPMLDRRIVEFALGLPSALNMSKGVGKQVLRETLYRHVPRGLIDRPKQGFAVPLANWLRGPLRDWAEWLLDSQRLREQGYWNERAVRTLWEGHVQGSENYSFELWGILMFQAWLNDEGAENLIPSGWSA